MQYSVHNLYRIAVSRTADTHIELKPVIKSLTRLYKYNSCLYKRVLLYPRSIMSWLTARNQLVPQGTVSYRRILALSDVVIKEFDCVSSVRDDSYISQLPSACLKVALSAHVPLKSEILSCKAFQFTCMCKRS